MHDKKRYMKRREMCSESRQPEEQRLPVKSCRLKIVLKIHTEIECEGVNWNQMAMDKIKWKTL